MNMVNCLYKLNKWWQIEKVENAFYFKRIRSEISSIVRGTHENRILAVTGPRGCGKTTLFYQSIDYLLKMKTPANRILMISGGEPALFTRSPRLKDILAAYADGVLHEELEHAGAPVFIFIDEIHRIDGWQADIEAYMAATSRIKFIVSAPNLALLYPTGRESLRPRTTELFISPLSPQQFIEFYCAYRESSFDYITYKSLLPDVGLIDNPGEYVNSIFNNLSSFSGFRQEKLRMINDYILAGGYPGYFQLGSLGAWQDLQLDKLIDNRLYGDIVSNYTIKSPEKLKNLLYLIASGNGEEQAYATIGRQLSLNTVTIINHILLLARNGLILVNENFSGKRTGISRKNKRFYVRDSGVRNSLIRRSVLNPDEYVQDVKNICVAIAADYTEKNGGRVCFWRSNQSELDILIECRYSLTPVQIIYKDDISRRDLRSIHTFMRSNPGRNAIVVTKDTLAVENNIYFVPFWLI